MYLPQTPVPIGAPVLSDEVVHDLALAHGRDPQAPTMAHLEAALDGDEAAQKMVAEMARRLTLVAGTIALVLDPEAFILSGTAAHPALVDAVSRVADELAVRLPLRFLVSSFGAEAPLVGAIGEAAAALRATVFAQLVPSVERPAARRA